MRKSSNYDFWLPEAIQTDDADIEQISENIEKLDAITKIPIVIQSNTVANTYKISIPFKTLHNDIRFIFVPLYNNTGAATLEIEYAGESKGVKKIINAAGSQISTANMIQAQRVYLLTYNVNADGGNGAFVIQTMDADTVDGKHASDFATAAQGSKADAALPAASYTAADILNKIKTVDGSSSGLDADTVDGLHATAFATASQGAKADAALPAASYTASDILTKIKTVDGPGSGLDADLLDGKQANDTASNIPVYDSNKKISGKAATAGVSDHLAGGSVGQIPYQSAANTTAMLAAGTSGYVLQSGGASAPSWINATNAATASTIVKRDSAGRAKVAAPSASDDIARKDTVDALQTALTGGTVVPAKATNLNGGGAGQIPYQSAANTTAMLAAGTSGYILKSNGASAPSWVGLPSLIVINTGILQHDATIPLPEGFTQEQCKWMVSVNEDNYNHTIWDVEENLRLLNYHLECMTDVNRKVYCGATITPWNGSGSPPTVFLPGKVNYIIIGVK